MDGSTVYFQYDDYDEKSAKLEHKGVRSEYLVKLEFLSAVRGRRHGQ
jgi:hypothetical protein